MMSIVLFLASPQVPNATSSTSSKSTFSVTASLRRPKSAKPKLSVKKQQQQEKF